MQKITEALGVGVVGAVLMALVVFIGCVAGAALGGLSGWIVGWFFDDTIARALKAFGVGPLEPWQLGAFVGFIGAFFRSHQSNKNGD